MKGLFASALLGVLLALPVAAQIAGSGQRTESDESLLAVRKTPPAPVSSPQAVPKLSGAPMRNYRTSPLLKVDVQAASRLGRMSGIRVISGSRVTLVQPGAGLMPRAEKVSSRRSQMKLIRIGDSPLTTYTRYGAVLSVPHETVRPRPATIRVNP